MTDFIRVTPDFSVAPQLQAQDIARAAAAGFKTLICNRPDHESPDQALTMAEAEAAAAAAGLAFRAIPFAGPPPAAAVAATQDALEEAQGPILAYCRSGTRSITAWALAMARRGQTPDALIKIAAEAGYDLSGLRGRLSEAARDA